MQIIYIDDQIGQAHAAQVSAAQAILLQVAVEKDMKLVTVNSAEEGKSIILSNQHEFKLAIVDGHFLEEETQGFDIVRSVRKAGINLPIIAFSSNEEHNEDMVAIGADEACLKRFYNDHDVENFANLVRSFL